MIIFCLAMCLIISDDSLVLFYSNTPQLCCGVRRRQFDSYARIRREQSKDS